MRMVLYILALLLWCPNTTFSAVDPFRTTALLEQPVVQAREEAKSLPVYICQIKFISEDADVPPNHKPVYERLTSEDKLIHDGNAIQRTYYIELKHVPMELGEGVFLDQYDQLMIQMPKGTIELYLSRAVLQEAVRRQVDKDTCTLKNL